MKVKLSKYLKPYALFAVLTPLSMVGEVLGDLLQPKLMSKIVDDGVLGQDMNLIIRTGQMCIRDSSSCVNHICLDSCQLIRLRLDPFLL